MLKHAYIAAAQTVLAAPMHEYYGFADGDADRNIGKWSRWFASLGAIYHIDRMIGLDIPWWNVSATGAVERFLSSRREARVFEFGSGASTVWLSRRAQTVISVEHDIDWALSLEARLAGHDNIRLIRAAYAKDGIPHDQPYVRAIEGLGLYDLIVVDGRLRTACLTAALAALKSDGIILFDDSGRKRYRHAIEHCGLIEKRYRGLSYCVPYPDNSSILQKQR